MIVWGGVAAVFCLAPLALLGSILDLPVIPLTAAMLAGLAWPAALGATPGDVRRTRALLLCIAVGIVGSLIAGVPGTIAPAP